MENIEKNTLAHDLRTPLTTIKGYASMLQDGVYGDLGEKANEAAAKILAAVDEMAELIEKKL